MDWGFGVADDDPFIRDDEEIECIVSCPGPQIDQNEVGVESVDVAFQFLLSLIREVGQPDQLASATNQVQVGAPGWKNNVTELGDLSAQEMVEVAFGKGYSEVEMEVGPTQISVDEDDLVSQYGKPDPQVRCDYGLSRSSLSTCDRPDLLVQFESVEEDLGRML